MKNLLCNLCNADDYTVLFPAGVAQVNRIVCCNKCGLMYANPQGKADYEGFPDEAFPEGKQVTVSDLPGGVQYYQKQITQLPDNERALRVLNELLPNRGKLLEIGCNLGVFLNRIRDDGWDVTGLEPDLRPAAYARQQYNLNIVTELLSDVGFGDAAFDAVALLHVIEHLPDPAASIREIRRILKPGGVIVLETPRYDTLMFKLMGRRERSLAYPGHIFFFTVPTLRQMLEKCGFEVVKTEIVGRTLTADRLLHNIGIITKSERVSDWLSKLSSALHLDKMRLTVNARDMQRVYARAV
jgi:2-polyprenyl-3-methyl-5-hydroxy-6-metoxy-1,4-benzoquinol methylase